MLNAGEDELVCDFAETYHILDLRALPVPLAATLAWGLRPDARIRLKMAEQQVPMETLLLAGVVDRLSLLLWQKTENGQKNRNSPAMLTDKLLHIEPERELKTFASGEEFRRAWSGKGGGA